MGNYYARDASLVAQVCWSRHARWRDIWHNSLFWKIALVVSPLRFHFDRHDSGIRRYCLRGVNVAANMEDLEGEKRGDFE